MPNTASAQLLENRGKLKTSKSEGRGFLHFLKRNKVRSADPAGSFSGRKGKVKYSPAPKPVKKSNPQYDEPSGVLNFKKEMPSPRYSPASDRQFKGKKNKAKSKSGSMSWFGSDGGKSYFNPSISGFQGQQRRPNQKGSKLYFKDISRIQSKVVIQSAPIKRQWPEAGFQGFDKGKNRRGSKLYFRDVSRDQSGVIVQSAPIKRQWPEAGFQGFDKGKNRRGSKLYFRDVSRDQSGVVVQSIPIKRQWPEAGFQGFDKGKNRRGSKLYFRDVSRDQSGVVVQAIPIKRQWPEAGFQGFDRGPNRKGSKLFYKELSREQSKVLIGHIPFENATRNSHKFQGFDKGKNKLGEKLYYREISRDLSGVLISYKKPEVFKDTHKFRGLSKDRTQFGEWWFQWSTSRAQARFEGDQKSLSYAEKMKYADKMAGKMAGYTGGFKTPKRNNKMHPSASYVYGMRAKSQSQKELFRKLNVVWVRVNGNKVQPDSVKDRPEKLKFDKKEKDLWNY